ncbi:MAG: hypothetical protein WCG81_16215 [Candidatus Angelobacter sp.]
MTDDSDDILNCGGVDLFGSEVDALVVSIYEATIEGIEGLDRRARDGFKAAKWSDPGEKEQELIWWKDQVSLLRYHAGNMGLVSVVALFDRWLLDEGPSSKILPSNSDEWSSIERWKEVERVLGSGPLSLNDYSAISTARNAIVHHANATEFKFGRHKRIVASEFIAETDRASSVGVSDSLLSRLAEQIKAQVELWSRALQKRKPCP